MTDNQAAEHLATQPNLNEHGRSIDIRHHEVRQDYLEGNVRIGGVKTTENPSDILTKFLPAPAHQQHSKYINLNLPKPYTQNGNFLSTTIPHPNNTNPQQVRRNKTPTQITAHRRNNRTHQKSKKDYLLRQRRKQRGLRRDTIPSPKPSPNCAQLFTYPNKTFAEFIYNERQRQLRQCPTTNTPWNTFTDHATPPEPRPRHPRTSPYIASPPMATHNPPKPIRVDTTR